MQVLIPEGAEAAVLLPAGKWLQNSAHVQTVPVEAGTRLRIVLHEPGRYEFVKE